MIRQPKMPGVTVHFASGMMIKYKKDEFLNNKANKQRFIHYLSDNLERAGCSVDHAKDDADVLIVMTAVASARHKETLLIGTTQTCWSFDYTMQKWTHMRYS